MLNIVDDLRERLGADTVLDGHAAAARARNYWDPAPLQARALVRPGSTAEVSRVMELCCARGQSVVVHGGLTGVCDGDRSTTEDVVLSLEHMKEIEEIDTLGRTVTVQAGCTLQALQAAVEREGLYFPLDLGARGSCSEGTLGIVTRVVFALRERPVSVNTALAAIEDGAHISQLLKLMDRRLGGTLSSFEAMWGDYFRAVTGPGGHVAPMSRDCAFYVLLEAHGPDQEADTQRFNTVIEQAFEDGLIVDAVLPKSGSERERLWAIREHFEAILTPKPVFLYDISVPLVHMLAYVQEVEAGLKERWPQSVLHVLGHLGDGNLHFFIAPRASSVEPKTAGAIADEIVYTPLSRYHGAVSAEHGIGLEKKKWMPQSRSAAEIELMRLLKRTLDPKGILNPGKVIDG